MELLFQLLLEIDLLSGVRASARGAAIDPAGYRPSCDGKHPQRLDGLIDIAGRIH